MAPFLVCDPTDEEVTDYVITLNDKEIVTAAYHVDAGVQMHYDLVSLIPGSYSVTAKARRVVPLWGILESDASAPFSFERPGAPLVPKNISLGEA